MLAVLLSLGAALGWGVSDFLGGLKSRSMPLLSVAVAAAYLVSRPGLALRKGDFTIMVLMGILIVAADFMYAMATTVTSHHAAVRTGSYVFHNQ